jgi:hypothetical protein
MRLVHTLHLEMQSRGQTHLNSSPCGPPLPAVVHLQISLLASSPQWHSLRPHLLVPVKVERERFEKALIGEGCRIPTRSP